MGILNRIKDGLNIDGVQIEIVMNPQISKKLRILTGKLIITTKSEKKIERVKFVFNEEWKQGRGNDRKFDTYFLGSITYDDSFIIKPGETKEINFELPFDLNIREKENFNRNILVDNVLGVGYVKERSNDDKLQDMGGIIGQFGKISAKLDNESSSYILTASADIDRVILGGVKTIELYFSDNI